MSRVRSLLSFRVSPPRFASMLALLLALSACRDKGSDDAGARRSTPTVGEAGASSASGATSDELSWPMLPRTPEDVHSLVSTSVLRRPAEPVRPAPIDGANLVLHTSLDDLARAPSGESTLRDVLAERASREKNGSYLLVGVNHASADSVALFKKLVEAPASYTHVGVELFAADGHWSGLADDAQRGSSAALDAYFERGDASSFAALKAAHEQSDYVAWKLGYADTVLDLAVAARAGAYTLVPLDLAPAMKASLANALGDTLLDLREVHAALSLRSVLKRYSTGGPGRKPVRMAMLWGDTHVGPAGIARFLPASVDVTTVHVVGANTASLPNGAPGGTTLVLNDPVLLPGKTDDLVVVLPDEGSRGTVDRVRLKEGSASAPTLAKGRAKEVTVNAGGEPGTRLSRVALGRQRVDVNGAKASLRVSPGAVTYVLETKSDRVVGALTLAEGETCDLSFDAKTRTTRIEHHLPK